MLRVRWDCRCIILLEILKLSQTLNGHLYNRQLQGFHKSLFEKLFTLLHRGKNVLFHLNDIIQEKDGTLLGSSSSCTNELLPSSIAGK